MLERDVERKLGRELKKLNCLYYKFTSPGSPGVPDRIVIAPDGRIWFVELKRGDSGVVSAQQKARIHELRMHGQAALVLRGWSDCEEFLARLKSR